MTSWRLPRLLRKRRTCPECGHAGRESFCDVCGYDLVEQTRARAPQRPGM